MSQFGGLYKPRTGDTTVQEPNKIATGKARYSHAETPAAQTVVKRPTYVLVNRVGSYLFAYESGSYPGGYTSGSVLVNAASGPVKLDISPVSWGSATQATGDVTFVYVRVS